MSFSTVHSPSGIRVITGADTNGFSYIGVGKGLKSHSITPFSEANVLAVNLSNTSGSVKGKRGTQGGGHRTPLGCPEKYQTLAGPLEGERAKGLSGVAGPAREDGAGGPVGNQAESQVLRGEGGGE